MDNQYTYLNFVNYSSLFLWDIKRYFATEIHSSFPIVRLGEYIKEENTKYRINDSYKTYGILGVNNQSGIFDAYEERGSRIKQKYKKMQVGWIAYNPYRVNVGSIGIRKEENLYEYISPAYVVFSCKKGLMPDYLFVLMKTDLFKKIIRENTTGSVRQNLNYSVLSDLQIPLPSIEEQKKIVDTYNSAIANAEDITIQEQKTNEQINSFWQKELGTTTKQQVEKNNRFSHLKFINFSNISEWGVDIIQQKQKNVLFSYPTAKIKTLCRLGSGGTPSRSCPQYYKGTIPWVKTAEVVNNEVVDTEEHITELAIANSSAKLYPKDSLIIAMYGQGDTRGRTAKLGVDATTNQACAVLYSINNSIVLTDYLWYYLQGCYHDLRSLASGNNQPNLNAEKIKNYDVVIPPIDIQSKIVGHISELKKKILSLSSLAATTRSNAIQQFEKTIFE